VTFPGTLPGAASLIAGWQLMLNGNIPYYNVVDNPDVNTLVLDGPVVIPSGSASALIGQFYFQSEKSDFQKVRVIVDYINDWQFRRNVKAEELANVDPQRSVTGPPQWLVQLGFNSDYIAALPDGVVDYYGQTNASTPQPWFESWPRTTAAQAYPYAYIKNFPVLSNDDDPLPGFIRSHVLVEGGLADACLWPGTPTMPNPMYNPVNYNIHNRRWEDLLLDMKFRDENVTQRQLGWLGEMDSLPYPELTTMGSNFWQSHANTSLVTSGF
jgi:hypothetical protein